MTYTSRIDVKTFSGKIVPVNNPHSAGYSVVRKVIDRPRKMSFQNVLPDRIPTKPQLSFFHNPAAKTHRKSKLGEGFRNFCQDPLRYPFIRPNSPTIVAANIKRKSVMVELPDIEFKIARQILQNEIRKFLYADLATSAPTAVTAPFPVADCGNVYRELDGILLAFDIDAIIAELPTGSQSAKAAKLNTIRATAL